MRYLTTSLSKDLQKKAVFLAGPRQVGKSTLAKSLVGDSSCYLNWDISSDQKIIRQIAWPKSNGIVVLDELHKYTKWKSFLKGVIDHYGNKPPLLVTGSARLETFRRGGDALTGRTYLYRLHPIDPVEAVDKFGAENALQATTQLLTSGGFPEAYLNPREAARLREDRLQVVIREDVRDLSTTIELRGMQLLVELLRERVGSGINYSHLASDIGVSPPTVKKWIELLERLYVVFLIYPHSRNLARSIRREPKAYFFDCSAATNGDGACFENLVACALLKRIHFLNDTTGSRLALCYYRDKDKREVDFVITAGLRAKILIEAKLSDNTRHGGLSYLVEKIPQTRGFQLVYGDMKRRELGRSTILGINALTEILAELET